jgi:uncharacterized Zn-binding protein involved in type VI secretion
MAAQGRLGDKASAPLCAHGCPACPHPTLGPAIAGSPNVRVNGQPALRVDDTGIHGTCCGPNQWRAMAGSATVFLNGKAAHRVGDGSQHCGGRGQLLEGSPNVSVGGAATEGVTRSDLAGWRVEPGAATREMAHVVRDDPRAEQRAALRHAAISGAALVNHDCEHCEGEATVAAVRDPIAEQANRDDDRLAG